MERRGGEMVRLPFIVPGTVRIRLYGTGSSLTGGITEGLFGCFADLFRGNEREFSSFCFRVPVSLSRKIV